MSSISADNISKCANCGKGEENGTQLKTCTACKMVKYCNRKCQIAHRPQHKSRIRAGEMLVAQGQGPCLKDLIYKNDQCMEISDEELFQQPPPKEDCPICFLPMPHEEELCGVETVFQYCCGKRLCIGCSMKAGTEMDKGNMKSKCPFCNVRMVTSEKELAERCKARMKQNDANAYRMMGVAYQFGSFGLPQDWGKALEMWVQAAELGWPMLTLLMYMFMLRS